MKALDLFCGLGGWSDGLAMEGFEILGVDINQEIADLYKHPVICEDVRNLDPQDFKEYDLIVGSPPCRDFSNWVRAGYKFWKNPPDPEAGLELVHYFLDFIDVAEPKYWLLENNPNLRYYLDIPPRQITRLTKGKRRAFWGNYPAFLLPRDFSHPLHDDARGPYRSWYRAIIPLPTARALGRAVASALTPTMQPIAEITNTSAKENPP